VGGLKMSAHPNTIKATNRKGAIMPSKTAIKQSKKEVAGIIKELRTQRELSQDALAQRAGVDRKTVNRIENNHFSPSHETLTRILDVLNVDIVFRVKKGKS
jgi:DNA-binding XRE family transcriptional regulator